MAKLSVDQTLSKANSCAKKGEIEEAQKLYQNVLQAFPKNGRAQKGLEALRQQHARTTTQNPPQELIHRLLGHYQNGRLSDAEKLAAFITQEFPRHQFAWKVLGALLGARGRKYEAAEANQTAVALYPKDTEAHNNLGHSLQELGRFDEAVASYKRAIALKPDFAMAHNNLGNTLKELGRLDDAEKSYTQAIALKPDFADAHNNLGVTLKELGRSDEAEKSYTQAIALKPDYAEAHNNLGNMLQELGRFDEAEASYKRATALKPDFAMAYSNLGITLKELGRLDDAEKSYTQAIALKPDFAEAHNNLGNTLKELGRLDEAETSYTQAIALKPDFAEAKVNLMELLTIHTSQKQSSQPIVKVDQEIKEISLSDVCAGALANGDIVDLIHKASNIIEKHSLDIVTDLSQTYRRNLVDLNCTRHKQIFDKFNFIPEFCFGCYKVQIEPRSVVELIKLYVLFDQITLSENNTRKCMVEMRSEVSGFYKGLIYCSSLSEAYEIADYLAVIVKERFGSELSLAVKRGCSEYSNAFPDYNKINKYGAQEMNYNADRKPIEDDYDSKNPKKYNNIIRPSLSCLSLNDFLIMRNWIDYAKGIGDSTAYHLNQSEVVSQTIYKIAKSRLQKHFWREPT